MDDVPVIRFLRELRRRRVFRVAGLYVVGVWLLLQAANMLFPAWGIPDAAMRFLLWAGLLGFPLALVFGWVFDISTEGIRRTQPVGSQEELLRSLPLRRPDYAILAAFLVVVGAIIFDTTGRVLETATTAGTREAEEWRPSAAEIEPHSVAVLPFASLSTDPEQAFFADGISEEILNRLSAFRELKVIARTSSFVFKDSGYDIGRISSLLAVNYVLQGSVRRDGERLRIAAQLVDRKGVQVWSSSFDRELGGIFVLQDEIAEAVATSIVPQIVPPAAVAHHEPDLEAYQEYLIGRENVTRRTALFHQRDVKHFDRAIELDPQFAEPHAARAITVLITAEWAANQEMEAERAARDIARALELNPGLAMAHAALGLLEDRRRSSDLAAIEQALRRAIELDPNFVDAYNWLSTTLRTQGRFEEMRDLLRRAVQIDPLAPGINTQLAMRDAERGQLEAAERRLLRLLDIPQPSVDVYMTLVGLYAQNGRLAEAVSSAKRLVLSAVRQSSRLDFIDYLAIQYARLGMLDEVEYWFERQEVWPEMPTLALLRSQILGMHGHLPPATALADFEAALEGAGLQVESLADSILGSYGALLVLNRDVERAVEILEPLVQAAPAAPFASARHSLAWARLERGESAAALELLEPVENLCQAWESDGRMHLGYHLVGCALTALLAGQRELALERLTRAVDAGWCGYYEVRTQPWWRALDAEPAFQALVARLQSAIEEQRALVEAADATDEFEVRLTAALALAQQ
jgi:TolB-like protein/Flp pilus assembly protein TadD